MLKQRLEKWIGTGGFDEPVFLVGGSVRDFLLDRHVKDIDLTCSRAREIAAKIAKAKNAALVPMEKDPSAPCYRIVNKNDPQDFLDITRLRGPDIYSDLGERDFSINAMALPVHNGLPHNPEEMIVDPLSGLDDLKKGVIRSLGRKNLEDDPLRILRAFRFAAQLDFKVEKNTLADCATVAPSLDRISGERIASELFVLFNSEKSAELVRCMSDARILDPIFPDIPAMRNCSQDGYHHADVWTHSLDVYEGCENILNNLQKFFGENQEKIAKSLPDPNGVALIKLAALLHDLGKPSVAKFDQDKGRTTFLGHAKKGAILAEKALRRLRLKNKDRDFICLLVAEHLHTEQLAGPDVREKTRMAWFRKLGDSAVACVILAIADTEAKHGKLSLRQERQRRTATLKGAAAGYFGGIKQTLAAPLLLNGNDLIALGVPKGPAMGKLLRDIQSAQDTGKVKTKKDALALARTLL